MPILYRILFYLLTPFILLRLLYRSIRVPGYALRWPERFGFFSCPIPAGGLWVHSVSMGETIAVTPLIKRFQQCYPDVPVTITTMTVTGSEQVTKTFGDSVFHVYVPYDMPGAVRRFLSRVRPSMLMLVETELWPVMLDECHQHHIPVIVVNARLSERSAKKYARFPAMTKAMLDSISAIAVQTQAEARRFVDLGVANNKLAVTGSIKFDITVPASAQEQVAPLKQQWGVDRLVWVVASTHEGEEEIILNVYLQLRETIKGLLLILVPRHPDRFSKVASLCSKYSQHVVLRSSGEACDEQTQILLGDTMGEMMLFYTASDVAFVAGSFAEIGGHNVLEPAALGLPIVTGPHVFNFLEINRLLQTAGALESVANSEDLYEVMLKILQDPSLRASMGEAGKQVVAQNRGALDAQMQLLQAHFQRSIAAAQETHALLS